MGACILPMCMYVLILWQIFQVISGRGLELLSTTFIFSVLVSRTISYFAACRLLAYGCLFCSCWTKVHLFSFKLVKIFVSRCLLLVCVLHLSRWCIIITLDKLWRKLLNSLFNLNCLGLIWGASISPLQYCVPHYCLQCIDQRNPAPIAWRIIALTWSLRGNIPCFCAALDCCFFPNLSTHFPPSSFRICLFFFFFFCFRD